VVDAYDASRTYTAILEYELPREARRPDVIILENGVVVVLGLKGKESPSQADIARSSPMPEIYAAITSNARIVRYTQSLYQLAPTGVFT
jgi:hypothetical protein